MSQKELGPYEHLWEHELCSTCHTPGCTAAINPDRIFCQSCLYAAGSEARSAFVLAFPYARCYHTCRHDREQREAVARMIQSVQIGKSQLSLFC
jgi:hypothetical protein